MLSYGTSLAGSTDGAITIQLKDAWGNNATAVGSLNVAGTTLLGAASGRQATVLGVSKALDGAVGQHVLTFYTTTADSYTLALYVGDKSMSNAAGTELAPLASGSVVVLPAAASPVMTLVTSASLSSGAVAGSAVSLAAVAADAYGNLRGNASGLGFFLSVAPNVSSSVAPTLLFDGSLSFSFVPRAAGAITLRLTDAATSTAFWSASVTVAAGPAAAAFSSLSGAGLLGALSGQASTFGILAADVYGNPTGRGGDAFFLNITAGGSVDDEDALAASWGVDDYSTGSYTATYTLAIANASSLAKTFTISVTLGGLDVGTQTSGTMSPLALPVRKVVGEINATRTRVTGFDQLASVVAGASAKLTVVAIDAIGTPLTSGGSSFSVVIDGTAPASGVTQTDYNGTYSLSLDLPTSAGVHTLAVYLMAPGLPAQSPAFSTNGSLLQRSDFPLSVKVVPAAPSASTSRLSVLSGLDAGGGIAAGVPFAYVLAPADQFGNALPPSSLTTDLFTASGYGAYVDATTGVSVNIACFGLATAASASTQKCALGTAYTESLGAWTLAGRLLATGSYTISASLSGGLVGTARTVTVRLAALAAVRNADGGSTTFTAGVFETSAFVAYDAYDNVIPASHVVAGATISLNDSRCSVTTGSGLAFKCFLFTKAGVYQTTLTAKVGETSVSTALKPVTIVPAALNFDLSVASIPSVVTTIASQPVSFTITALDSYSNALSVGGAGWGISVKNAPINVTDFGNGSYAATVPGIANSGSYKIDVQLLTSSRSFSLRVTPRPTSAAGSVLTSWAGAAVSEDLAIMAGPFGATFWIRPFDTMGVSQIDDKGSQKVADVFRATLTGACAGSVSTTPPFTQRAGYQVTVSSQTAGPCQLAVVLVSGSTEKSILGSPFNVTVSPGPAFSLSMKKDTSLLAHYSVWDSSVSAPAAAELLPSYASWLASGSALAEAFYGVSVTDAYGNVLAFDESAIPPLTSATSGRVDASFTAGFYGQMSDGRWLVSWKSTLAGDPYPIFFVDEQNARLSAYSVATLVVRPGPLDLTLLRAAGTGIDAGAAAVAGQSGAIYVTGYDSFGNTRPFNASGEVALGVSMLLQVGPPPTLSSVPAPPLDGMKLHPTSSHALLCWERLT